MQVIVGATLGQATACRFNKERIEAARVSNQFESRRARLRPKIERSAECKKPRVRRINV